ncbi:sigma-54 interaction domain-containing protein [Atlantibacter hermannii]|uniref:sigma-54 interaction domain-containing protein n=1 Tax=Atlantibacter hermannii TaxID=565 RepID=UPI0013EF2677|nr:sigma-54 dependent transcriptional regulator [Atlantibacter hermannii]MDU1952494.1 sigma-54 dependent transcriptional regulator [Atlantibacter hermannii]
MSDLIAEDSASLKALSLAKRVASFNVPVLIQGETGTGKECIAKYIHSLAFPVDQAAPYIGVNCAAIPETMLESSLFGYEKGAFTGATATVPGKLELANNGTLLLDEIGDMPLALQAKLLRALQEHKVERLGSNKTINLNFRLIACTNKDLEKEVAEGRFREDLYYRISVVPLHLPPLRERRNDIILLAESFLEKYAPMIGGKRIQLSPSARQALLAHSWPGNVRQLENAIQRGMILNQNGMIYPECLGLVTETKPAAPVTPAAQPEPGIYSAEGIEEEPGSLGLHGRHAQYQYIANLLHKYQGNKSHVAGLLGITPRALRYRLASMRKQGIDVLQFS